MKKFLDFLDPERKGPLFWHYGLKGIICIAVGTYLMYLWIVGPRSSPFAGVLYLFTIGIHEAGHSIFRILFMNNFFMTVIGGTVMELGVPILAFFSFLHRKHEIQADVCILLLAIACYSVGHYTGYSLDPEITLLGGPEAMPDWDYMHKWFGTEGYEYYVRHGFYWLCSFLTALGLYLFIAHFWEWNDPDKHNYNEDYDEHDSFFLRG